MGIISREFAASPVRTSTECWEAITDLVCGTDESAKYEFKKALGIGSALIAENAFKDNPMIIKGVGSQLRVYCIYDQKAIEGDAREEALSWQPTNGKWECLLPCIGENFSWAIEEISKCSEYFSAYTDPDSMVDSKVESSELKIDEDAFRNL